MGAGTDQAEPSAKVMRWAGWEEERQVRLAGVGGVWFSGRERGSGDAVCILLTPERGGSAGNHKVFLLRVNGLGYIFWRRIACFLICRMINISPLLKGCLEE